MPLPLSTFLPQPRAWRFEGAAWSPTSGIGIDIPVASPALDRLDTAFSRAGFTVRREERSEIRATIDRAALDQPEAYRLIVNDAGVRIVAGDEAGLFYALLSLAQLVEGMSDEPRRAFTLPGMVIEDAPALAERGVMLDVSRDRIPTMKTLFALVDLFASWKLNRLQLYTEHTFAYEKHETVWRGWDPLTANEIRRLDAYCAARFIELVPNQQSFGHLHHWLRHDEYRALAECPDGVEHPFSRAREPFSICPTDPAALTFIEELYDELLPCFRSRTLNVGADETFDLGEGRTKAACAEHGSGRVYLDFLHRLHELVTARGSRMQFWADVVLEHPELVDEIPRDAIPMLWGYEATHPFAEQCAALAASGLEFHVCPGTSGWQSIGGRTTNLRGNVAAAIEHGLAAGAAGMLITDWGDRGHLQPLPVAYAGWALAAALAWNPEGGPATEEELAEKVSRHAFADPSGSTGAFALSLGRVGESSGARAANASPLSLLLSDVDLPFPPERIEGLTRDGLEAARVHAARLAAGSDRLRAGSADAGLVTDEMIWAAELLEVAARLGIARVEAGDTGPLGAISPARREELAARLSSLTDEHRRLWLRRCRPGGLDRSAAWLERVRDLLRHPAS